SLRQLQYAVAVAATLSFRKAAELCHVSQPSLSAQLAQLEHALGVRLFERDRRRVLVTASGKELVARARRLLLHADDLSAVAPRPTSRPWRSGRPIRSRARCASASSRRSRPTSCPARRRRSGRPFRT